MATERINAKRDIPDLSDEDAVDIFTRYLPKEPIPAGLEEALTKKVLEKVRKVDWENSSKDRSLEEILTDLG